MHLCFYVAAFWPSPDVREFVPQIGNCLSSAVLIGSMAVGNEVKDGFLDPLCP